MPAGVPVIALRRSAAYSAIIGVALGSIMAAIMTPQAARNPRASVASEPAIGAAACVTTPTHAARARTTTSAPVIRLVRSRGSAAFIRLRSGTISQRSGVLPQKRPFGRRPWASLRDKVANGVDDRLGCFLGQVVAGGGDQAAFVLGGEV